MHKALLTDNAQGIASQSHPMSWLFACEWATDK